MYSMLGELSYQGALQLEKVAPSIRQAHELSSKANGGPCSVNAVQLELENSLLGDAEGATEACSAAESVSINASPKQMALWRDYWLEYTDAFDKLQAISPDSLAAVFIGRHAVELGLKYLLIKRSGALFKTHALGKLAHELLLSGFSKETECMSDIVAFCEHFSESMESDDSECFCFPEDQDSRRSVRGHLDNRWICLNLTLVLLKLHHLDEGEHRALSENRGEGAE